MCCWRARAFGQGDPADPNDALTEPSFVKDGQVDVDAVVKYFEDLYRSDSSISEAKADRHQAPATAHAGDENVDPRAKKRR